MRSKSRRRKLDHVSYTRQTKVLVGKWDNCHQFGQVSLNQWEAEGGRLSPKTAWNRTYFLLMYILEKRLELLQYLHSGISTSSLVQSWTRG